jgi:hypothetical protein
LEKDESNLLYFDVFGEWLEHEGIKMWWMVKGRGKLGPNVGQSAKMDGRPAITSLFLPFVLHYSLLYLNHRHFGK